MKKTLLTTIGFGTCLCVAACGSNNTPSGTGPGADAAAVGLDAGAIGLDAGAIGLDGAAVGLDAGAVGLDAVGLDAAAAGPDDAAVGLDAGAVGLDAGAIGLDVGAVGLDAAAVGLDAGVVETGSTGPAPEVSCDFTTQGMRLCTGFSGLSAAALAQEQTACLQQNQGTFSQAACVSANVSGTCTFTSTGTGQFAGIPAGTRVTYVWYSLPANEIASAQLSCTGILGGTWSGG